MADAERISGGVTWLQTGSPEGLAVELAVRDWSRRDSDVAGGCAGPTTGA